MITPAERSTMIRTKELEFDSEVLLTDLIAKLIIAREGLPFYARDEAKVEIESIPIEGCGCMADIQLVWTTPETDEEVYARRRREEKNLDLTEARERETLARLKAKYEVAPPPPSRPEDSWA